MQNPEASACSAPRRLPLGSKSKEHHVAENGYAINESGYPHIFLNCNRAQRHVEENNYFTEMCSGSEAGSYLRLTDFAISLNSRLESNKEEEEWICDQREWMSAYLPQPQPGSCLPQQQPGSWRAPPPSRLLGATAHEEKKGMAERLDRTLPPSVIKLVAVTSQPMAPEPEIKKGCAVFETNALRVCPPPSRQPHAIETAYRPCCMLDGVGVWVGSHQLDALAEILDECRVSVSA